MPGKKKMKLPFIVYEITPRCNLSCKYCYNIWKRPGETAPREYPFNMVIKTLKQVFKMADVDNITFSGGEPFVFPRLLEVALFCRMRKKGVTMISNGYKGTREDYKTLINMGVQLFELPVHSCDPNIHDDIAGKQGAWKRSITSIKEILDLGGEVVAVIVITKKNFHQVYETMRFIQELGVKRIMLNRFNIGGAGIKEKETISLSNNQLREAFASAQKAVKKLKITASSNVCTPFCVLKPEDYPSIGFSACYPKKNIRPWTLDPSGSIRFCNHSPHVIGNIYHDSFEDILKSAYVKEWQNTIPEVCKDCSLYEKCWAGCRAAAEQIGLPLKYADPIVYDELGIKIP